MKNIKQNRYFVQSAAIVALAMLTLLAPGLHADAATSAVNFDPGSGMFSVTGSCSGRFVLILIKNASNGSIWGSSNPPCVSGAYSYSLVVPEGVRTGNTFMVNVMDNGVPGSGGTTSQPIVFIPAPGIDQTATSSPSSDLSITIDTSSLAVDPNSTSFFDGVLQDCFGIVTSALNSAEASVVAAVHLFAKMFTIIPGGSIMVPSGQNQISGQGTLAAGASEVFIANTAVTSSSQIIVTPTSPSQLPLAIMQVVDGDGFNVGTISPQQIPISFTWLIVNTYNAGPPAQAGLQQGSQSVAAPTDNSAGDGTVNDSTTGNNTTTTDAGTPTDSSSTDAGGMPTDTAAGSSTDASNTMDATSTADITDDGTVSGTVDTTDVAPATDATDTAVSVPAGDASSTDTSSTDATGTPQ